MVDGPFGSSVNTSEDYVDEGIPVVRTINITDNGFSQNNLKFMRTEKFNLLKRHAVKPGDILFSKVGTIGNVCILPDSIPEAILSTTGSCRITVNESIIIPQYLVFLLRAMRSHLILLASSNVQPFLNMETIKNIKIPVPPIEEQPLYNEYSLFFSNRIDIMLKQTNQAIKKLEEYRTTIITAAVTGKIKVI